MPKYFLITIFTFIAFTISANQSVKECTSIENDQERLVCYDKIFLSTNELIVIDSSSVIEIKKIEKEEEEKGDIIDVELLEEDIDLKDSVDEKEVSITQKISLKASEDVIKNFLKIKKVKRVGSNYSIELNDGSVWKTNESIWNKSLFKAEADVLIEKGSFGSNFIKFKGTKTKVRVKKIK